LINVKAAHDHRLQDRQRNGRSNAMPLHRTECLFRVHPAQDAEMPGPIAVGIKSAMIKRAEMSIFQAAKSGRSTRLLCLQTPAPPTPSRTRAAPKRCRTKSRLAALPRPKVAQATPPHREPVTKAERLWKLSGWYRQFGESESKWIWTAPCASTPATFSAAPARWYRGHNQGLS
jgi:hypothetical protein